MDATIPESPLNDPLLRDMPTVGGYKVLDRRYVIYGTLGQGGMGVVFQAKHADLDVDVAIKCLDPLLARRDKNFVERFRTEARSAASIQHENVVRVMDVADVDGLHYLVMEFVRGEDARKRVSRKGQLKIAEAAHIALGLSRGLAAAHEAGLIHRDVKPDNVMIGVDGDVKVADLGLAKQTGVDSGLTHSGAAMGTPRYMPPEQFGDAKNVTYSADVYSIGATLYYLLTGVDAVPGGSIAEILDFVRKQPYPDPRKLRPDTPDALAQLVADCTRKDPLERPQNAGLVVPILEAALAGMECALADPDAGTKQFDSMVSPPPPETIAKIRLTMDQTAARRSQVTVPVKESKQGLWVGLAAALLLVPAAVWLILTLMGDGGDGRDEIRNVGDLGATAGPNGNPSVQPGGETNSPSGAEVQTPDSQNPPEQGGGPEGIPTQASGSTEETDTGQVSGAGEDSTADATETELPGDTAPPEDKRPPEDNRPPEDSGPPEDIAEPGSTELEVPDLEIADTVNPAAVVADAESNNPTGTGGETPKLPEPDPVVPTAKELVLVWAEIVAQNPGRGDVRDRNYSAFLTKTGLPWKVRDRVTGIEMILVPAGNDVIGKSPTETVSKSNETPAHLVNFENPIYMGRTEVTAAQWASLKGGAFGGSADDGALPVVDVSFVEIQSVLGESGLRLPFECEWEYACRAGSDLPVYSSLSRCAWSIESSGGKLHPPGELQPNDWGFADMLGNAWEFCGNAYDDDLYNEAAAFIASGARVTPSFYRDNEGEEDRVVRGGSYRSFNPELRASRRKGNRQGRESNDVGFRVVREVELP